MMINLGYFIFFVPLLIALLLAIMEMSIALDEIDIERFTIWTGVASVIAALPIMLW